MSAPLDNIRILEFGEHTNEVLREWLGYSDDKIESLIRSEVI